MRVLLPILFVLFAAAPARAAEEWGLPDEKTATFRAKVVDVLCELTGDCPKNCGEGKRQLGLLADNGELILAFKNVVPFAGAAAELRPHCGKKIWVDGVFTSAKAARAFAVQNIGASEKALKPADRWLADWARANKTKPDSKEAEEWYLHDPAVKREIARGGKLGLGAGK